MAKAILKNKSWLVLGLCLSFILSYSNAFAWGHRERYHYREGRWHRSGWFGIDIALSSLTVGTVVESLPAGYTTIVVSNAPYYYYERAYFRPCPNGYIVVPAPAVPAAVVNQAPTGQVNPYYLPVTKIAEMASTKVPDSVIIGEIQRTHSTYSLTAEVITYLKQNRVSDQVINYMLQTANK